MTVTATQNNPRTLCEALIHYTQRFRLPNTWSSLRAPSIRDVHTSLTGRVWRRRPRHYYGISVLRTGSRSPPPPGMLTRLSSFEKNCRDINVAVQFKKNTPRTLMALTHTQVVDTGLTNSQWASSSSTSSRSSSSSSSSRGGKQLLRGAATANILLVCRS